MPSCWAQLCLSACRRGRCVEAAPRPPQRYLRPRTRLMPRTVQILANRRRIAEAALISVLALCACGGSEPETLPDYDPVPFQMESPATEVDTADLRWPV